jgi:hypothetical protein
VLVGFEVSVLNIFTDKETYAGLLCVHHHRLLRRGRYVSVIGCFGVYFTCTMILNCIFFFNHSDELMKKLNGTYFPEEV